MADIENREKLQTFGAQLRDARLRVQPPISQGRLARAISEAGLPINQPEISLMERGFLTPYSNFEFQVTLQGLLGISPEEYLDISRPKKLGPRGRERIRISSFDRLESTSSYRTEEYRGRSRLRDIRPTGLKEEHRFWDPRRVQSSYADHLLIVRDFLVDNLIKFSKSQGKSLSPEEAFDAIGQLSDDAVDHIVLTKLVNELEAKFKQK